MVETAEQHSKISKRYDKLADDESMSLEQRAKFARSANCHRILARIPQIEAIRDQVIQPSLSRLAALRRPQPSRLVLALNLILGQFE
jgi:hypothetical protein